MAESSDQRWKRVVEEKRTSLSKITLIASFRIKNYEGFQAYFSSIVANPAFSDGSDTFNRFIASLDPLRSFTMAASAASRDEDGVQMIWAALHALVEVSYQPLEAFSRPHAAC